ncbi:MAG: hypothetical protein ACAI38_01645 [Myxococcota bacterium]
MDGIEAGKAGQAKPVTVEAPPASATAQPVEVGPKSWTTAGRPVADVSDSVRGSASPEAIATGAKPNDLREKARTAAGMTVLAICGFLPGLVLAAVQMGSELVSRPFGREGWRPEGSATIPIINAMEITMKPAMRLVSRLGLARDPG